MTVFNTSKEAAYPKELCKKFAEILAEAAGTFNSTVNPSMDDDSLLLDPRVATGKQPRGTEVAAHHFGV